MRTLSGFLCVFALAVVPLVGCGGEGGMGEIFPCTEQGIRDAIAKGGGPHTFDCDGSEPVVTEAEIIIDNDVILDGEGNLTVDANQDQTGLGGYGVFKVEEGVTAELHGFAVTGGVSGSYGGISNEGTLTVMDSTVSDNSGTNAKSASAGGIENVGTMTLTNSTVSGNTAVLSGGIGNRGTLTVTNSSVSGNSGSQSGGILNDGGGTLALTNSTVSGHAGVPGLGAGILNMGDATLTNSTVSENSGDSWAGGIFNDGMLRLTNSTVSGNSGSRSGGIWNNGTLTLANSTVSANSGEDVGGLTNTEEGTLTVTGSVIDGDCGSESVITSNGYNIESPGDTCGFDPEGTDQVNVLDAMLGPLQDNGGPTQTHAITTDSAAFNQIPPGKCEVDKDQRGVDRPQGPTCDIGAFELEDE